MQLGFLDGGDYPATLGRLLLVLRYHISLQNYNYNIQFKYIFVLKELFHPLSGSNPPDAVAKRVEVLRAGVGRGQLFPWRILSNLGTLTTVHGKRGNIYPAMTHVITCLCLNSTNCFHVGGKIYLAGEGGGNQK